jgi:hypothetical protein
VVTVSLPSVITPQTENLRIDMRRLWRGLWVLFSG